MGQSPHFEFAGCEPLRPERPARVEMARALAPVKAVAQAPASSPVRRAMPQQAERSVIGLGGRLSYLFGRACGRIPGISYVRHRIVAVDIHTMPPMPRGYYARLIGPEELTGHRIDACAAVQAERFAAGMLCLGAFNGRDALVGVTWLDREAHDERVLGVRFRLPTHAAWDGGLWIDEERRLSRAFVALWAGIRCWLDEQGLRQSISSIADYNAASLAAHRSLGARVIGHVAVLRVGGYQLTFGGKGGRARLTRAGQRPEIRL
jgi:hypothetical protein